jgi:hypothetical protein
VTGENEHRRVFPRLRQQPRDARVDGDIDITQGIAEVAGHLEVVARVQPVVQVPELMPGAVRFREDGEEEIPSALREEVARELRLERHAAQEPVTQRGELGGLAPVFIARSDWISTEPGLDLAGE